MLDALYFAANALKITQGGWAPLVIAAIACLVMSVWRIGERRLSTIVCNQTVGLDVEATS